MTEYTREQILAMEAGTELNALIAEKVMGWTIIGTKVNKNGYIAYLSDWKPSTDISASFEVVEKMKKEWGFTMLNWGGDDPYEVIWGYQEGPYRYSAQTATEAICKAALLAVMGL